MTDNRLSLLPKSRLIALIRRAEDETRYWRRQTLKALAMAEQAASQATAPPSALELAFALTPKDPDAAQHFRDLADALDQSERTGQRWAARAS